MIRTLENATGRLRLIRRASGYQKEVVAGADFWDVMVRRYGLRLDILSGSLEAIPSEGPLVVVANHPYGILDGLMMGHILHRCRSDFRILAHKVFRRAEDLSRVILPISFDESKNSVASNLETRKKALAYLDGGGAIGVFPGGTVSTSARPFSQPFDPSWRPFTAKMITKSGATVVPIYFDGANSRLFQVASHLHSTLRLALLINEFGRRTDTSVRVVIGKPINGGEIATHAQDGKAMMDFLRASTYALSPKPLVRNSYGFEFDEGYRKGARHGGGHI